MNKKITVSKEKKKVKANWKTREKNKQKVI
jgi:hypothetical protein